MKNKMVIKLVIYFYVALLLFSIIIGSVFITLFKNHTIELEKTNLEERATSIAATLSLLLDSDSKNLYDKEIHGKGIMSGGQGSMSYLRYLDDIAMADVWIVDENLELITLGYMANKQYNYTDLPPDAELVVKEVFNGKIKFSEGFSNMMDKPTLTVGTPILSNDKIIGALLLHSPVEGINEAIQKGFMTLIISIIVGSILSIIFSILLAYSYTKPLKKMKDTALELVQGNYDAKTGVAQNDEIGELADTIDILSDRLKQASKESEKLMKLRRDFVANISHELRTPVTVLRGSLEALKDEVITDPKQIKDYYEQMLNESLFLQRLVDDLLDLSRLQNFDFKIDMEELNLCDLFFDILRSAQKLADNKGIVIEFDQFTKDFTVNGDYGRLRQMFMIIIDNAIKFSLQNSKINITLSNKFVSIRDNGIGIKKEDLPYIFDRFYKVKSLDNKNGTGLGLAIAKQIADRHNVRLNVNSKINEGTEFLFDF